MLTDAQQKYLETIPEDKKVRVFSFDNQALNTAEIIIESIYKIYPGLKVMHLGASALRIAGQNDLDIYAFSRPNKFNEYILGLTELFGQPKSKHDSFIEWRLIKNGYEVEFYLTDPDSQTMKGQIAVFEILKADKDLLSQYEALKLRMNGKSFREYQRAKYEFYNQILKG